MIFCRAVPDLHVECFVNQVQEFIRKRISLNCEGRWSPQQIKIAESARVVRKRKLRFSNVGWVSHHEGRVCA